MTFSPLLFITLPINSQVFFQLQKFTNSDIQINVNASTV
jgi:hypothetical protein